MVKISDIRTIVKCISRIFNSEKCLLTDWITLNIELISRELNNEISTDEIFDNFSDERTSSFNKLFKELRYFITSHGEICRINISEEIEGISICLNELGKVTDLNHSAKLWTHFKMIESWDKMKKGIFFENFCAKFLEDLGLEAEVTIASGDKGIDIIAKYQTQLKEELGQLVFNDFVYLLAQAKFMNKKVDEPILRKILGDSILLRFDRVEYLQIAHNAFHLLVFSHNGFTESAIEFAKQNKIMIINTEQIISIISGSKDPSEWECYKFIISEVKNA